MNFKFVGVWQISTSGFGRLLPVALACMSNLAQCVSAT